MSTATARVDARRDGSLPALDGCRAVAAFMVLVAHTAGLAGLMRDGAFVAPYMTQLGLLGVSFFFVLSGFLLYRPFVSAHLAGDRPPAVGAYFRRRVLRIFPAYWVALTVYLFVLPYAAGGVGLSRGFQLYGLAQIYTTDLFPTGIPAAWSLAVEVTFYLLLPAFAFAVRAAARRSTSPAGRLAVEVLAVIALYAVGTLCRWLFVITQPHAIPILGSLPALCDWFAIGMTFAIAYAWFREGGRLPRPLVVLGRFPAVSWGLGLVLFWVGGLLRLPGGLGELTAFERMARSVIFGGIGLLFVAPAIFGTERRSSIRDLLTSRPLRYAGLVSYGVFLWHQLVLKEVFSWLDGSQTRPGFFVLLVPTVTVTTIVASLSWYLIEQPAISLKGRPLIRTVGEWLVPRRRPAPPPVVPANR